MKKIKVKFVGGSKPKGINEIWGGSSATYNAIIKSFENDEEIEFISKCRLDFLKKNEFNLSDFLEFISDCDILHIDDTSILENMFINGIKPPDIIGPVSRSPLKEYKDGWTSKYTKEWFYSSQIIRLNYSEERNNRDMVSLIRHGIDTEFLKPNHTKERKYVLWAGMIPRYAKNYDLMKEIMEITTLPEPFEFKVLSNYNVLDYWNILDETSILINTSRYESFCNALFEARSKGVATIQPINLNGIGVHQDAPIQVEYDVNSYKTSIMGLLENNKYKEVGNECREYCVNTASLKIMRDDIYEQYLKIINLKKNPK